MQTMSPQHHETRRDQFEKLVNRALDSASPYDSVEQVNLDRLYRVGVLTALLVYSAVDQIEVWEHLENLADRKNK